MRRDNQPSLAIIYFYIRLGNICFKYLYAGLHDIQARYNDIAYKPIMHGEIIVCLKLTPFTTLFGHISVVGYN